MGMNMPPEEYVGPGEMPHATATSQMTEIIRSVTRQVQNRGLSAMSYELEVEDTHGNKVKGQGMIYGPHTAPPKGGLLGGFRRG